MHNPKLEIDNRLEFYLPSIIHTASKFLTAVEVLEMIYIMNDWLINEVDKETDSAILADMIHFVKWELILSRLKTFK